MEPKEFVAEEPIADTDMSRPEIEGVGILRYPEGQLEKAREIGGSIRQGTILGLPNTRNPCGDYEWDFRIEGGDPGQVQIKRSGE